VTVSGVNQCTDLEEVLLAFPKSPNDDTRDSAAYQVEIAQPPSGGRQDAQVRHSLTTFKNALTNMFTFESVEKFYVRL
jgi:hypothetical protein